MDFLQKEVPGIRAYAPDATFLLWLDYRSLGGTQAEIYALFLEKGKIALNAGATFGESGEGFMRMNLACPMATVDEGLKRIQTAAS